MPAARVFNRWLLDPPSEPGRPHAYVWEEPTGVGLLERLRTEAELQSVGRSRFSGTLKHRNAMWRHYRTFLRQALSNFRVALTVENRSASLLYYYAMLNFGKAELLRTRGAPVLGPVSHGLSFSPTKAKSVSGDYLTVRDGVFPMLYKDRTGYEMPVGARLPIARLLGRIPEIAEQLTTLDVGTPEVSGVLQLIAFDHSNAWVLLAVSPTDALEPTTASGKYLRRFFRQVDPPRDWRDRFGVSRRWKSMSFYESVVSFPYTAGDDAGAFTAGVKATGYTWSVKDLLGLSTMRTFDAWLSPSLYRTRMFPMPPAMARYAMTYYASSLVRYRPSMFDTEVSPTQAYLFDALARECAVPMLIDTLSALTGIDSLFLSPGALRL